MSKVHGERSWRQGKGRDNGSTACSYLRWEEEEVGGGGGKWAGGFSLRSADAGQGVTDGAVNISQISAARSGSGGAQYRVSTPGKNLLFSPVNARKLMRPVWAMMRTYQRWSRGQKQGGLWRLEMQSFSLTDCATNDHYLWRDASVSTEGVNKGKLGVCTGHVLDHRV